MNHRSAEFILRNLRMHSLYTRAAKCEADHLESSDFSSTRESKWMGRLPCKPICTLWSPSEDPLYWGADISHRNCWRPARNGFPQERHEYGNPWRAEKIPWMPVRNNRGVGTFVIEKLPMMDSMMPHYSISWCEIAQRIAVMFMILYVVYCVRLLSLMLTNWYK